MLSEDVLSEDVRSFVDAAWADDVLTVLSDYIRIPNVSPAFDPEWAEHGHMDRAVALLADWCRARPIEGLSVDVVTLEGRTPVIFMEIPAFGSEAGDTVLLYGHLDKQPEMVG